MHRGDKGIVIQTIWISVSDVMVVIAERVTIPMIFGTQFLNTVEESQRRHAENGWNKQNPQPGLWTWGYQKVDSLRSQSTQRQIWMTITHLPRAIPVLLDEDSSLFAQYHHRQSNGELATNTKLDDFSTQYTAISKPNYAGKPKSHPPWRGSLGNQPRLRLAFSRTWMHQPNPYYSAVLDYK